MEGEDVCTLRSKAHGALYAKNLVLRRILTRAKGRFSTVEEPFLHKNFEQNVFFIIKKNHFYMFHFNQFQRKTNEQIKSQYEEKQQFIPNNKIKISNKKEYLKQNKKKNPRYGSNLMPPWKLSETDLRGSRVNHEHANKSCHKNCLKHVNPEESQCV